MLIALGIPNLIAVVMLLRPGENQYLAILGAGVLLLMWCGYELLYLFNVAAVGYFVVGAISVLFSVLLLRPAVEESA